MTTTIRDKRSGGSITFFDTQRPEADPRAIEAQARAIRLDHMLQSPRAVGPRRTQLLGAIEKAYGEKSAAVKAARAAQKKADAAAIKAAGGAPKKAPKRKPYTTPGGYEPLRNPPAELWRAAQMDPKVIKARRAMAKATGERLRKVEDDYYKSRDAVIRRLGYTPPASGKGGKKK